ncbi:uncharacterized protein LOC100468117 isoform X2 [Ailuropoda melanoleuca]|uniref:uncharacterized protein LOC100468117 isoform X2 n=1 Tax=Ailuropoda melanoleuca TaxID=9646 RepID=UPI001493FDC6|nr:uncharacterized protein LOC100468117 isoform X2 [Ailuropoda melanoleuca]
MLRAGALSRAAASRGLVLCSRAPGGLAREVGAVVAARGRRLRRRGGCGAESRPPGSARSPSGMEVLDEFDSEFPQSVTFCQLISEEDFERQAATYTERALRRLFRSIDRNPALAERVAKFFCAVQGELNCCNSMGALEMHQRLEQLKRSMHRVHLLPGCQEEEKKAETEETRTHPLARPINLPMPPTNVAATSTTAVTCHHHGLRGGPITPCLHYA